MKFRFLLSISFFIISFIVLIFLTSSVHAAATHVVISEIQVSGNTANDEFVELYNPTTTAIDLTGWKLRRENSNGATTSANLVTSMSGSIPAHGFFLITSSESLASNSADLLYSNATTKIAANNTVLLFDNTNVLLDKVGIGSASDVEGTAIGNPAANESVERKANSTSTITSMTTGADVAAGNGEDTDNNAADFILRTVSDPQNSHSAIEPIILSPTPSFTLTPSLTITPTISPSFTPTPSTGSGPTATLTPSFTITPTFSVSPTPSATPTNSPTVTPTFTLAPTESETLTPTFSPSPTMTITPTFTLTPTVTPTVTPTTTPSPTPSTSSGPSATPTLSVAPTMTVVLSPTKMITPTPISNQSHLVCSWHVKTIQIFGFRFVLPFFHCERIPFGK